MKDKWWSTHKAVDAKKNEVDGYDDCALDVDDRACDWVVVEEQVGKKSLLVRRVAKQKLRYSSHHHVGVHVYNQSELLYRPVNEWTTVQLPRPAAETMNVWNKTEKTMLPVVGWNETKFYILFQNLRRA